MRDHVKILGILNMVWGGLIVLAGGIVLLVFGGIAGFLGLSSGNDSVVAAPIMALIGVGIACLVALVGIPGIIGGWGLINFKSWARVLMIIVSILHLPNIPVRNSDWGLRHLGAVQSRDGAPVPDGRSNALFPAAELHHPHPRRRTRGASSVHGPAKTEYASAPLLRAPQLSCNAKTRRFGAATVRERVLPGPTESDLRQELLSRRSRESDPCLLHLSILDQPRT